MCNKRVNWQEWLGGTAVAFVIAGIMHGIAVFNMTDDIETWSGRITHACHFPQWVEEYKVAIYKTETYTTGTGKNRQTHTRRVFSHYETRHDTHSEHWIAYLSFGTYSEEKSIDLRSFNEIKSNFGNVIENDGKQSSHHGGHFDGGDNNIYKAVNKTDYVYPVTTIRRFENRIKAAPTLFSFAKVPTNAPVYNWPENPNWMHSDRLLGVVGVNPLEFDRMNARLGPHKRVNVIMVGFNSADSMLGKWQEAKWIGSKKNDIVLCYGFQGTNVLWSYVFGWTEQAICKRNLETILLTKPINTDILPAIEKEIKATYIIKDWSKFDYITIEPPRWAFITLIILMVLTQGGFWVWSIMNPFTKDDGIDDYENFGGGYGRGKMNMLFGSPKNRR